MTSQCDSTKQEASRLARDVLAQEITVDMPKQHDINLVSVQAPDTFSSDHLVATLVRQVIGAIFQIQRNEIVERLKHARKAKLWRSKVKSLKGKPKLTGRKSMLEGKKAAKIKHTLRTWTRKQQLKPGDTAMAARALTAAGVRTSRGKTVSLAQTKTWVLALRKPWW